MLKLFFFCTVLYNIGSNVTTFNFGDKGVCMDYSGNLVCCFDHTLVNGKCVGCTIGFRFKGGSCMPCETNWYGKLCLQTCTCAFNQRCDNVLGCVNKTLFTQPASSQSTTSNTENFTQTTKPNLSEESEITNPTSTKKSSDGLLDREIVICTVVVACIIVILGLSYLVQKYRKKTKKESMANTAQRTHSIKAIL
ncbi:uncharacterized protein LOC127712769 isoform X3 [Mytilus californianus]|uniref:uncharacterized protein LOC127712769 isoform X2 n=1 Tax=Mytilus californianus TaxID=6549 RepID=UPI0022476120|nr:uncharacterized protein LOC127712769 isoform X2 [Mytilus californianus]XP_052075351.1 uncharacterized protein LOC127712769 isoform X3 [Mytilus californianus]